MLIVNSFGPTKLVPFAPDYASVACRKKRSPLHLGNSIAGTVCRHIPWSSQQQHCGPTWGVALRLLEPFRSSGVKLWYDSFTRTAPVIKISHDSDAIHDNNKQQHPIGGKELLENYVMRDDRGFAPCACKMHHNVVPTKFHTYCDCSRP